MRTTIATASALSSLVALATGVGACTAKTGEVPKRDPPAATAPAPEAGAGSGPVVPSRRVDGASGTLFGAPVKSFALLDGNDVVESVGVVVPLAAFIDAPRPAPFQDDLVIEMPEVAKEQTFVHHLRVNWLASGHGPKPYGAPHFDMHFLRGTVAAIDRIDCRSDAATPPSEVLAPGYKTPDSCVPSMGYHAWPKEDGSATASAWRGSIILGYWAGKMVFVEPMIPASTFGDRASFELAVAKPASAGGAPTLYPTHFTATWDDRAEAYTLTLDRFEPIDR